MYGPATGLLLKTLYEIHKGLVDPQHLVRDVHRYQQCWWPWISYGSSTVHVLINGPQAASSLGRVSSAEPERIQL